MNTIDQVVFELSWSNSKKVIMRKTRFKISLQKIVVFRHLHQ